MNSLSGAPPVGRQGGAPTTSLAGAPSLQARRSVVDDFDIDEMEQREAGKRERKRERKEKRRKQEKKERKRQGKKVQHEEADSSISNQPVSSTTDSDPTRSLDTYGTNPSNQPDFSRDDDSRDGDGRLEQLETPDPTKISSSFFDEPVQARDSSPTEPSRAAVGRRARVGRRGGQNTEADDALAAMLNSDVPAFPASVPDIPRAVELTAEPTMNTFERMEQEAKEKVERAAAARQEVEAARKTREEMETREQDETRAKEVRTRETRMREAKAASQQVELGRARGVRDQIQALEMEQSHELAENSEMDDSLQLGSASASMGEASGVFDTSMGEDDLAAMGWDSDPNRSPAHPAGLASPARERPASHSALRAKEGEVRATFVEEGKFGITFATVAGKEAPGPMKITKIDAGGLGARHPELRPGLVLTAVQGRSAKGQKYKEAQQMMRAAPRPITLTFTSTYIEPESDRPLTPAEANAQPASLTGIMKAAADPASERTGTTESGLSGVALWADWLGIDLQRDSRALVNYASEAAKQRAPPPWTLSDGWYANGSTGHRQRKHPLVETLRPRVESLRDVTSNSMSSPASEDDRSAKLGAGQVEDDDGSNLAQLELDAAQPLHRKSRAADQKPPGLQMPPAASAGVESPALSGYGAERAAGGVFSAKAIASPQDLTRTSPNGLAVRVGQLEQEKRVLELQRETEAQRMATERAMLDERVEHAQLRNSVDSVRSSFAAGSPHGGVAGWVEEKGILLEKNLAEKRRYDALRAKYDALVRDHEVEVERLKDEHAVELARARASRNEMERRLSQAESTSGAASPLSSLSSEVKLLVEQMQADMRGKRSMEAQLNSAVDDIRSEIETRRDLDARAFGDDKSRTSIVLTNIDLKMQELQAQQAEMQRRQAEEAARLQAERARLEIMQQSLAQERKLALEAFNRELRDLQAERDGHQGEYEAGLKELLDERRKLMLEREAIARENEAREKELAEVARSQAQLEARNAAEQSALKYQRKAVDREIDDVARQSAALVGGSENLEAQRVQMQQYSQKLNELGRVVNVKSAHVADAQAAADRAVVNSQATLDEAKQLQKESEQIRAQCEAKLKRATMEAMAMNRERLQLATEQRDLTDLRQTAETEATEAKAQLRALQDETTRLKVQLAQTQKRKPVATEGGFAFGRQNLRSVYSRSTAFKVTGGAPCDGRVAKVFDSEATSNWEADEKHAQQLLDEQRRFLENLLAPPTIAAPSAPMLAPPSPMAYTQASSAFGAADATGTVRLPMTEAFGDTSAQLLQDERNLQQALRAALSREDAPEEHGPAAYSPADYSLALSLVLWCAL